MPETKDSKAGVAIKALEDRCRAALAEGQAAQSADSKGKRYPLTAPQVEAIINREIDLGQSSLVEAVRADLLDSASS